MKTTLETGYDPALLEASTASVVRRAILTGRSPASPKTATTAGQVVLGFVVCEVASILAYLEELRW